MRQSHHSIVGAKHDSPPKPDIKDHLPSASSTGVPGAWIIAWRARLDLDDAPLSLFRA